MTPTAPRPWPAATPRPATRVAGAGSSDGATAGAPWRPWRGLSTSIALVLCCAALVLGLAPAPAHAASTTGSGNPATETRAPGAFEAVVVSGSIDVRVRQAAFPAVAVTADDNLLALVETVVEDSRHGRTLKIGLKRGTSVRARTPIRVVVDTTTLRSAALAGSGDLAVERFDTPELSLSVSGSGDAVVTDLTTVALTVRIAGSGDVRVGGSAVTAKVSIAGSGDADLSALPADAVEVAIAGSGDAAVVADRSLKVSIAGSGDVTYAGRATDVRSSVAGSGSVRRR